MSREEVLRITNEGERFAVTSVSRLPAADRRQTLARCVFDPEQLQVEFVEDDYTVLDVLAGTEPAGFDSVLFLASDGMQSSEEADARTVLGYVLLRSLLEGLEDGPQILVELLDPLNSRLFEGGDDMLLVSPRILSRILAHVALRPELNPVYEALFIAGGVEITLRTAEDYGIAGETVTFEQLEDLAHGRGEVALGVLRAGKDPLLNPAGDWTRTLKKRDELIVLARDDVLGGPPGTS